MRLLIGALALALASTAWAETNSKIDDAKLAAEKVADLCDSLFGDEIGACYKAASLKLLARMQAKAKAMEGQAKADPAPAAAPAIPSTSPVKLSGSDLAVQTHKWDGKVIQTQARCFFADKNEYRCLTAGGPRIDFEKLTPDRARDQIETRCDTIQKMTTKACVVTLQFVYEGYTQQETGGLGQLKLVVAKDGAGHVVDR